LVIPEDLTDHPTVGVLLDVLQSARLKKEIDTLAGYESTATGDTIARW
jgi:molybdate-binding protein